LGGGIDPQATFAAPESGRSTEHAEAALTGADASVVDRKIPEVLERKISRVCTGEEIVLTRCRLLLFAFATLVGLLGPFCPAGTAYAQQSTSPRRIGVLLVVSSPESKEVQQFRQGLAEAGYSDGRDVVIEWRLATGYDQVPRLAGDLVSSKADVIVVETTVAVRALQAATSSIPLVMVLVSDPVGSGLVASLARPGGNITGLSLMWTETATKRLQLLKETVPGATRVAVLWNPDTPYHATVVKEIKAAAPSLSIEPRFVEVHGPRDLDRAFSAMLKEHPQALYVVGGWPLFGHRTRLLDLVSKARLPSISGSRSFADGGGLMSY